MLTANVERWRDAPLERPDLIAAALDAGLADV